MYKMGELKVKTETGEQTEKTEKKEKLTLMTAMDNIVELSEGSNLSDEFYEKAKRYISYVCRKLSVNKVQAVLLSLFVDNCWDRDVELRTLAEYLKCRMVRMINYSTEIDELLKRKMIRIKNRRGETTYAMGPDVIDAFKHNEAFVPAEPKLLTCDELFCEIYSLFESRVYDYLQYEEFISELFSLLETNRNLEFVKQLRTYKLICDHTVNDEGIIFVFWASRLVCDNDYNLDTQSFRDLFKNRAIANKLKGKLSRGESMLQKNGLIQFCNEDGLANHEKYNLTVKAKQEFLSELNMNLNATTRFKELIKHEDITECKMYYNKRESRQVEQLKELLTEERYTKVCSELKRVGMRSGFTCLFYGAPGTGKTETVMQLAKATRRDVIQVNYAELKSCWVGESEKNVKNLFDRYRALVNSSDVTPILLFNEADALIGIRQKGADRAVEKMENSIQNIILQELEQLEGIFIATTNLTENLDKAFERRFLYKIEFEKPSIVARCGIWKSMIPIISDEDICYLAYHYDFSGGQIENVARKQAIDLILYGKEKMSLEYIKEKCDEELIHKNPMPRVGFISDAEISRKTS